MATATSPISPAGTGELDGVNLSRILTRLEESVLSPGAGPRLRRSLYERNKVNNNLELARLYLLRLEHESSNTPQPRRSAYPNDLQTQRQVLKHINQRLHELDQLDDAGTAAQAGRSEGSGEDDTSSSSADELGSDTESSSFPSYGPAHSRTWSGLDREQDSHATSVEQAAADLTSTLRSRRGQPGVEIDTARGATMTTGSSVVPGATVREGVDEKLVKSEAQLSHNRAEQEQLTSSLLSMAQMLKSQSVQFGNSLESEKGVLEKASEGLDRNALGMEAAGRRMSTLRKMTEGRGWWGRMLMYAFIAGLWLALILIWALVPKLRF